MQFQSINTRSNPQKPQLVPDGQVCCLCGAPAWYATGEPHGFNFQDGNISVKIKAVHLQYYCGSHRAQARARQRGIWGQDPTPRISDRWELTNPRKAPKWGSLS